MKIKKLQFLKITLVFLLFLSILFVKAQIPSGIVPAIGIPKLVPSTVNELDTANGYCQLTFGSQGIERSITSCEPLTINNHQLGSNGNSHVIITTPTFDLNTCIENSPGYNLFTMPLISFWDSLNYGPLNVMKMGDDFSGISQIASASSTYYFTPTEDQNILLLWIAFVSQASQLHNKSQNGLFRVEITDLSGNFVTGDYYTSTFYIIPETTSDPIIHPCCHAQFIRYNCPIYSVPNTWLDWTQLTFDLRPFIGQLVKLRIIVSRCVYQYHYTYCYYTGMGVNGNLEIQTCNADSTTINAPVGFENYKWFINNVHIPIYDSLRTLTIPRNTSQTLFKCETLSETGTPIIFDKTINYYTITPDFNWQQEIEGDLLKVQFSNICTLLNITNGGNVSENIDSLLWDFGDGFTSTELNPIHYYQGIGPFTVTLKVYDNHYLCDEEISKQILLSGVSVNETDSQSISYKTYPNPFKEEIILEVAHTNEMVSFEFLNLLGQVVYQGKMIRQCKVQANQLQSGIYLIKFSTRDQSFYSKIVKE